MIDGKKEDRSSAATPERSKAGAGFESSFASKNQFTTAAGSRQIQIPDYGQGGFD